MIVLSSMVFRANPKKAFVFQLVVVKGIPRCQSVFRIVLVCLVKPITSSLLRVLWSDLLGLMLSRMDLVSFGFQAVNRTMFVILLRLFRMSMSLFSKQVFMSFLEFLLKLEPVVPDLSVEHPVSPDFPPARADEVRCSSRGTTCFAFRCSCSC